MLNFGGVRVGDVVGHLPNFGGKLLPKKKCFTANIAPENRPFTPQKETRKYSNHPFSGANC